MHIAEFLATLQVDHASKTALFHQLYHAIKQAILTGQLTPGMQLPLPRELSTLSGIPRQTVLNAYELLMAEGSRAIALLP